MRKNISIFSGDHTYFDVHVTKMRDLCDRGEAWRTWQNMRVVDWSKEGEREASFEGTGRGTIQWYFVLHFDPEIWIKMALWSSLKGTCTG